MKKYLLALAVVLLITCTALCETYYVNGTTGNDNWDGLSPTYTGGDTGPVKTIEEASHRADNGDKIIVADGVYEEDFHYHDDITLQSTNGPENCKLIINELSGENFYIDGFTIESQDSLEIHYTKLDINNCIFKNINSCCGDAIKCFSSNLTIKDSSFTSTSFEYADLLNIDESKVKLESCRFVGNVGYSSLINCVEDNDILIDNCTFENNDTSRIITADKPDNNFEINNSEFRSNDFTGRYRTEACFYITSGNLAVLKNCMMKYNFFNDSGNLVQAEGGAEIKLYNCKLNDNWFSERSQGINLTDESTLELINSEICGNYSFETFSGIVTNYELNEVDVTGSKIGNNYAEERCVGILSDSDLDNFIIKDSVISDNGDDGNINGIILNNFSSLLLDNCKISQSFYGTFTGVDLTSDQPFSVKIQNSEISSDTGANSRSNGIRANKGIEIENTLIRGDYANSIHVTDDYTSTIRNCTILNNDRAIYAPEADIKNCIIRGNIRQDIICNSMSYCNVEGLATIQSLPGDNNFDADPMFVAPEYGDYHLKSTAGRWSESAQAWVKDDVDSPCIDAGDPSDDIGDEPLGSGGRINVGMYGGTGEASKTNVCSGQIAGDMNNDCRVNFTDMARIMNNWLGSTIIE